ncbi:hypothetical protein MDOR_03890 [Mycolicibacterium doricum]|uniref:Uncharacterized protein n=2 Tax=Mycolicibacterium doricum TaxID=126673 RepID=A0A7I7VME1_9MYCO|nr:hypothetical protein MDOR_03890 [Mycolicibacterium doricum]
MRPTAGLASRPGRNQGPNHRPPSPTPSAGVTIDCLRAKLFGMPGKVTHVPNFLASILAWITADMPAPAETDRVRERLAAGSWPLDDRESGEGA